MITENLYKQCLATNDAIKYTVAINNCTIFDLVLKCFAQKLLQHDYSEELTDCQKTKLNEIIQK